MTKILCVIPARLNSTRLPQKPLLKIKNKPMVQLTYEAACSCKDMHKVIVATDAQEIADIITNLGGHAEMTPSDLKTGSDRVAYVAQKFPDYDVVVNLQGDEPFMTAEMLSTLVKPFIDGEDIPMSTLAGPIDFEADYSNPNIVKVLFDQNFNAIYFSRASLPFFRDTRLKTNLVSEKEQNKNTSAPSSFSSLPLAAHFGLYAYKRSFLLKYTKFPQTPLEQTEMLEQLRVIENGYKIKVCLTNKRTLEINTPEDLQKAHLCN